MKPQAESLRSLVLLGVWLVWGMALAFDDVCGQGTGKSNPPGIISTYAAGIFSAEPVHTEAAKELLLPIGARAVGMGRAVTAFQGNESAFWNPAGLAGIEDGRLVVLRGNSLVGEATALSLILARQPIGVLAFSYQFLDIGDQDFVDKDGNVLGTVSLRDHLGIVSFASQVLPWLDTGLNFKVYQTRLTCQGQCTDSGVTGTTYFLDAGLLARPGQGLPLRLGLMVAHAGPDLQLINAEQADPLPTRLRVAGAYEILNHFLDREGMELWVTAEMEDRLRDLGSPVLHLGAEFAAGQEDQIFLRAGYGQVQSGQPAGMAVGLGIKYQQFEIGIGKTLSGGGLGLESDPAQITFGVIF